jgi:hypothetical protein
VRWRRPPAQLAVAAALAATFSGCEIVYLPGDGAAVDRDATSERDLRRLVTAIPTSCDPATGARGTLRNRASRPITADLVVSWAAGGAAGRLQSRVTVAARAQATSRWSSRPPPRAEGGCSVGIARIVAEGP